jgi:hypothetical protein
MDPGHAPGLEKERLWAILPLMDGSPDQRRIGKRINEVYEPLELLFSGEAAEFYRARDLRDRRTVTLTLLRPELALLQQALQGFRSKAEGLKKLASNGLPRVLAIEADETGIPFVVEEDCQGEKLSAIISRHPEGLPPAEALRLVLPVMETMAEAHGAGLVHGQLALDKVVLGARGGDGTQKVINFLACHAAPRADAGTRGEAARSFSQAQEQAPECIKGSLPDARSDVWSLGVMLFKVLSGKWPLQSGGSEKGDSVRVRIRSLAEVRPGLPPEICSVVDSCIKIRPADRPADAAALGERLLPALRGSAAAEAARGRRGAAGSRSRGGAEGPPARAGRGSAGSGGKPAAPGSRAQVAPDTLRAQKARALVRQIAMDSQLGLRAGPGRSPIAGAGPAAGPGGHHLARQIARILYTPITLDLVTDRGRKEARPEKRANRAAPGRGQPAAESRERDRPGPAADPGAGPAPADDLAGMMSGDSLAALLNDRDMAGLLDADDLAVPGERDDLKQSVDHGRTANTNRQAEPAAGEPARFIDDSPIDYRIPIGRTLLRITLYGVCLLAIAGAYIFYREVISEQQSPSYSTQRGFSRSASAKPAGEERAVERTPADGPQGGSAKVAPFSGQTPEQKEMGGAEGVRQDRDRFKKPLFGR